MNRRLVRVLFLVLVISFAISGLLVSSAQIGLPVAKLPAPLPSVFDVRGPDGVPTVAQTSVCGSNFPKPSLQVTHYRT